MKKFVLMLSLSLLIANISIGAGTSEPTGFNGLAWRGLEEALKNNDVDALKSRLLDKDHFKAWGAQVGQTVTDAQAYQSVMQRRSTLEQELSAIVKKLSHAYQISLSALRLGNIELPIQDELGEFVSGTLQEKFTSADRIITVAVNCRRYKDVWYIDSGLVLSGVTKGTGENAIDDYGSIGVRIKYDADVQSVRIEYAMNGSPGAEAGLQAGDIIESIDGRSAYETSLAAVVTMIKGPLGSEVELEISRDGEIQEFRIKRELAAAALKALAAQEEP